MPRFPSILLFFPIERYSTRRYPAMDIRNSSSEHYEFGRKILYSLRFYASTAIPIALH